MNWLEVLKEKILPLIDQAAFEVLKIYQSDFSVLVKEDQSPLTMADTISHRIICQGLEQYNIYVVSEESQRLADMAVNENMFWLVDPLDGTKEFVKRNDEFTINIALIKDGRPVLGVVSAPALNKTYYAVKGHGAYVVKDRVHHKLQCSAISDISNATLAVSRSHLSEKDELFIKNKNITKIKRLGSALKYCELAEGIVDLSIRYTPLMAWDIAASDVILEEAGGKITADGERLNFSYLESRNAIKKFFYASNMSL